MKLAVFRFKSPGQGAQGIMGLVDDEGADTLLAFTPVPEHPENRDEPDDEPEADDDAGPVIVGPILVELYEPVELYPTWQIAGRDTPPQVVHVPDLIDHPVVVHLDQCAWHSRPFDLTDPDDEGARAVARYQSYRPKPRRRAVPAAAPPAPAPVGEAPGA